MFVKIKFHQAHDPLFSAMKTIFYKTAYDIYTNIWGNKHEFQNGVLNGSTNGTIVLSKLDTSCRHLSNLSKNIIKSNSQTIGNSSNVIRVISFWLFVLRRQESILCPNKTVWYR